MKTATYSFIFHEKDVLHFVQTVGDDNPIYQSVEEARKFGYETIPVPPTMPATAYQWIDIPWTLKEPVIHRKQQSTYHQVMYTNQPYKGEITITKKSRRNNYNFIQQELHIYDSNDTLCFTGISYLLAGDIV